MLKSKAWEVKEAGNEETIGSWKRLEDPAASGAVIHPEKQGLTQEIKRLAKVLGSRQTTTMEAEQGGAKTTNFRQHSATSR